MFTRSQYLNRECSHRQYYSQFVTPLTILYVKSCIHVDVLKASQDEHFNDIQLERWDRIPIAYNRQAMKSCGDYLTPAGHVCIMKEAARQILEE